MYTYDIYIYMYIYICIWCLYVYRLRLAASCAIPSTASTRRTFAPKTPALYSPGSWIQYIYMCIYRLRQYTYIVIHYVYTLCFPYLCSIYIHYLSIYIYICIHYLYTLSIYIFTYAYIYLYTLYIPCRYIIFTLNKYAWHASFFHI